MAKTSTQIEIPVSLKASLEGLKEVQTQVSQALNKAGKNTTLGKTLAKELSTAAAKFGEIDEILLSPTIDESGLKRLERLANQISSHFAQSFAKIDFSSFEQFATEEQLRRMQELQELTRKQRRELEAINKHGSQERTDTYLVKTGNEVALNHMRNQKGFDATQTLSKNRQAMERLSQSHERTIVGMKKQLAEYEQKADEAFNAWDAADKRVKVLEPQVTTLRKDSYAATFYDKIGRMNTRISANPETVNPKISSIEKELGSALRSVEAGGVIATEARDALKDWITHTFTNVNPTEASQMVGMTVNKLLEKLMEKIFGQGYEADREGGYDFSHSALLARGQDFADNSVKRLNAKHSTASASDLALVSQQKIKELREAQTEATTQENATERYMSLGMALEAQIVETQQAANHTRLLAQELGRYAEAAKQAALASKQGEINDSEQAQRDHAAQAKQEQEANYAPSQEAYKGVKSGLEAGFKEANESQDAAKIAAAEAEDFKKHLKQSITHWASAQQIINVVKNGIRQAYQDIKALDSAMTNIAVVTDMSIGDLWGKINEYMSIAKQYGVTTQGVYEVSQLYYQQGLSTNEVMAATTETLKMARIAGMDYAEAADAMTVAIRAFKMEMTDAEHVTDVYSKVAAVTASDSEELAIAMSKTASSAESVGSSFENTTAMLAVMIETTRESAQNLGSALKSIISRYGEMKVGLTVDSEGEEIDYNKVDTALKSVGISIKDAQGQFRDFDDVIFELSKKWDGLDKNTQRYIATIMAGNRQQSRFIALVDNWERLDEVSAAAADSADAGLLQYAKTLDSLDTKLNNMKTSFQNFYMSIINGPIVAQFMGFIQNILDGFNKLGQWQSLLNVVGLINSVKLIGTLLVSAISGPLAQMRAKWKEHFEEITRIAAREGKKTGIVHVEEAQKTNNPGNWATNSKWDKRLSIGGALVGSALTAAGTAVAADNAQAGSIMSGIGNVANFASMGAAFGPWGAAIGAIVGGLASLPAIIDAFDPAKILEEKIQKAEEALQEAEIERAQKKEDARNLEATLENLRKLQEARYDSEEAMQAYLEASDAAIEKYPELANTVDASGRQIADVITNTVASEQLLNEAREKAAEAALAAAEAERAKLLAEQEANKKNREHYIYWQDTLAGGFQGTQAYWTQGSLLYSLGFEPKLTNKEVFQYIEDLYDPNSELYQALDAYAKANGRDFYDIQNEMDLYFWSAIKGDKQLVGNNATNAREALSYHRFIMNESASSMDESVNKSTNKVFTEAVNKSFAASRGDSSSSSWQDVKWLNNLAASYIADTIKISESFFDKDTHELTASGQAVVDSEVAKFSANLDSFYLQHAEDLDEINKLITMASEGTISHQEYIDGLLRFGINSEHFLYKPLMDQYYQQDNASRAFYANAILGEGAVPTYEEFLKKKNLTDSASARADYNEQLRQTIQDTVTTNGAYLAEFVANASEQQLREYLAITKEYTDAEDIVGPGGEVARKRLAWMQKIYTGEYKKDAPEMSDYSILSPEAQAEFFRLLNTDAGTHKWAEDLDAFEKQYKVELGDWDKYAFENFSVRTQNIIDSAVSVTDTIKEIGEKHNKGFSWEESQKLLKQIQAIDPSATWTSVFKATEDGFIILNDADETMRQLYQKQSDDLDKQQATIDTALSNAQLGGQGYKYLTKVDWKAISGYDEEDQANFASDIVTKFLGIQDPELEAQILAGIQSGAIYSYKTLIAFLEGQQETLEAAGLYVDSQLNNTLAEQKVNEIQQTTIDVIESIFNFIQKAIEGTLSATDLYDMGKMVVSSGTMSVDEWHTFASQNISRAGTGYKMNEAAAFALQVNTGNYNFEDLVGQFDSIEEVNEMLEELSDNSKQFGNEFVEAAKRVLESIKMIKAQDPSDAMFNWMDQDMEGWAGTYESTMGSIGQANDIISASMESGTMGLNDFYNMSQIVGQHLTGDALREWEQYRDAVYATATTVDGGTVSLTAGGKSMEYALDAMSDSTEAYYQKIAKQQIDFIDKQIAALEAQKKVEEALKGDSGSTDAALSREDLAYTGITGDIGLYSEEEYAAAEKKWYGRNRVPGEDEYDPNAPEAGTAFAATVSKYIGEATQDALKAGLDITDAQVQQQIKDSAMARAGVSGYYDTLTDKNLAVLTAISGDVAAIREEVVQEAPSTTESNPEGAGTADNGFGTGNNTNYGNSQVITDAQDSALREQQTEEITQQSEEYKEEHLSTTKEEQNIAQQALAEDQQQTQHQANTDTNTGITVTLLEAINSRVGQAIENIGKEADTSGSGNDDTTSSGEAVAMGDTGPIFSTPDLEKRGTTTNTEGLNQDKPGDDSQQSSGTEKYDNGTWMLETGEGRVKLLSERQALMDERAALLKENQQLTADIADLEEKIRLLEQDQNQLREERDAAQKEAKTNADNLSSVEAQLKLTTDQNANYQLDIEALSQAKSDADSQIADLQNTNTNLTNQVADLTSQNANLENEISLLTAQNEFLMLYNNKLRRDILDLESKYSSVATEVYAYKNGYDPEFGQTPQEFTYDYMWQFATHHLSDGTLDQDAYWNLEDGTRTTLNVDGVKEFIRIMNEEFQGIDWYTVLTSWYGEGYGSEGNQNALAYQLGPSWQYDEDAAQTYGNEMGATAATAAQDTLNDNPAELSVSASTTAATRDVNELINKIQAESPELLIKVGLVNKDGTVLSADQIFKLLGVKAEDEDGLGAATGNVNGLAFATGTEKLIAGANLANKSLVGELGPELAVYNGQYHLLGANGAEFANIPSNAIIFNHKQTEGILKGQANIRGRVKDGGEAFAEGNVSGPAYASGIDEAIAALQEARAMWQSLLDTPLDKIIGRNKASGGGSGIAAVDIGELEEWYNLLRQIEAIQDDINLLIAERNNLEAEYDGEATLRNLRQQQSLLEKQQATQKQLIEYQRIQLERQKNEILNDPVWNKFLTFDESTGAIQYTKGNELFGGKGAWEFLQDLDQMSAKEQIAAVNKLGYTAKDNEGKQLTGEELVKHFVDAAKNIEEEYRNLDNTVRDSETELENIESNINEIEQTIRDNEMALEQNVFDTIVDAWEANIDALEEQKDLIEEANDAYVEGLREALDAERKAYEDEASVADREQLQRELSLLRRSGGSASEIADLEEQIDNALKDEYFKSQEDMIADIEEANKNQIELLEKQIQIEEETLEYQKENGVIWQQVATILSGTKESIMAFLSGSAPGFFAQSKNQQVDALNEWSYMIGLYKEDQFIKNTSAQALNDMNSSDGKMWGHTDMSGYYEKFSGSEMTDEERKSAADAYATEYAKLLSEGKTEEQAAEGARKVLRDRIDQYSTPNPKGGDIQNDNGNDNGNGKKAIKVSISAADGHGKPYVKGPIYSGQQYSIYPNANSGYQFLKMTVDGTVSYSMNFKASNKDMVIKVSYKKIQESGSGEETGMLPSLHGYKITYVDRASNETKTKKSGRLYTSTAIAQREGNVAAADMGLFNKDKYKDVKITAYKTGGIVDYTGLAMVHGSASKPEAFLNAEQTAQIKDALMLQTKEGLLSSLQDSLLKFQSTIDGTVSGITSEENNSSINIQPGAVVIEVEELANNYDVEKLSNDVMNRMTAIAAKATNRGVNRR